MAAPLTPVEVAQAAAASAAASDPLLVGLAWIAGIVTLIVTIGKPVRDYLRNETKAETANKAEDAKSGAEAVLYNHLAEQVREYRTIADKAYAERNDLIQRIAVLEAKTEDLETAQELAEKLKTRLDEKDAQIERLVADAAEERRRFLDILDAKDREIAKRDERIHTLENRQRDLEVRLAQDEIRMGIPAGCPHIQVLQPIGVSHDAPDQT